MSSKLEISVPKENPCFWMVTHFDRVLGGGDPHLGPNDVPQVVVLDF